MYRPFACFFLASTAFAPAQNWIHDPLTGHDYALLPPMTWQDAQDVATGLQAHLVAIESAAENRFIVNTFLIPSQGDLHIGMSDADQEGVWRTVNGLSAPFTNWQAAPVQQPDNRNGVEHYAVMTAGGGVQGQWDDRDGLGVLPAVIERPDSQLLPFGIGCAGSNGIPWLRVPPPCSTPRPGAQISLQLTGAPTAGGLAFMIVSFSKTQWGPNPLPYNLATFGMAGCQAFVALGQPGWTELFLQQGGVGSWSATIPNLPVVIGWNFYLQAWIPDAGANNQLGATVTNAIEGGIGV